MKLVASFLILFFLSQYTYSADFACVKKYYTHLRSRPTTNSPIIAKLKKYTPLKLIAQEGNWSKVETYLHEKGWIYSPLIEKNIKCFTLTHQQELGNVCPKTRSLKQKKQAYYLESFKVLKIDFNCNKVLDSRGRVFWVYSESIWPSIYSKKAIEL